MDDDLVITLFRHGMTIANERRAYLGWSDSPLSSDGRKRLGAVDKDISILFSSDSKRCTDTALLLFPEKPVQQKKEFRELHFGSWEGKTHQELQEDIDYSKWLADPFKVTPPHGESFGQFAKRVQRGWHAIKNEMDAKGKKQVAIVTHAGVIRYLLMKYAPVEKPFWQWDVSHGIGWELTFKEKDFRRDERCILLREVPITANPNG